jgi:hypothetical protein
MQRGADSETGASGVAGVPVNLRIDENDVNQVDSVVYCMTR